MISLIFPFWGRHWFGSDITDVELLSSEQCSLFHKFIQIASGGAKTKTEVSWCPNMSFVHNAVLFK